MCHIFILYKTSLNIGSLVLAAAVDDRNLSLIVIFRINPTKELIDLIESRFETAFESVENSISSAPGTYYNYTL